MHFELHIDSTLKDLLSQEDTDKDKKITIEDHGPKAFTITATNGEVYVVRGTYFLSNLLQELVIAKNKGRETATVTLDRIEEAPVDRVSRMIREYYWDGLTRTMDAKGLNLLLSDTKNDALTLDKLIIYVPHTDNPALHYYNRLKEELDIDVVQLPAAITPDYVRSINDKPGILALKLELKDYKISGVPFVVPGGRFNEMYGWDSYFEAVGLICDGRLDLAIAMAENFQYQIRHYGKILNANRSYYLTRTQPPFYTSMIRDIFEVTGDVKWLERHLKTAILEYETVWMEPGRRLTDNGLNRYYAAGIGMPPECEAGHFDAVIRPFADEKGIDIATYIDGYNRGIILNEALDTYFHHDRTVRESGHDTSYRIDGNCADLNLVELNAMLYKYELDFAHFTETVFNGQFLSYSTADWHAKMDRRREAMNTFLWDESRGLFFDYDLVKGQQSGFVAATTLTPLWAGSCSSSQAERLVANAMPQLMVKGGIAASTEESRGPISEDRPMRQWDFPNGWAPHQMMIWKGLYHYGYTDVMQEAIYRWLYMITKNAVDYNGTIPEKYDVVAATHKVFAEYGNVGTEFEYITQEGFGWMNASYQYGLSLLDENLREMLNNLKSPETIF